MHAEITQTNLLDTLAVIARIVQGSLSILVVISIIIAYISWKSKQNLDRRSAALAYSLTKNRQYFDARGEIFSRFKSRLVNKTPLTIEEIKNLKENNDKILSDFRFILSHWEIMAISIFDGIIDERTCYEMVGSTLVNTIDLIENYITDTRSSPHDIRRYDYLLILHDEWKKRINETSSNGKSISRYKQYLDLGRNRKRFERKLASDLADW